MRSVSGVENNDSSVKTCTCSSYRHFMGH